MKRDLASMLSGAVMPGDDASTFVQRQLHSGEPQLPQYDPQGGWDAAKSWGQGVAGTLPGGGIADAAGQLGGPSLGENWRAGNYGAAALQGLGVGADLAGPLGLGAKLAMAMAPAAKVANKVAKARGLADTMADAAKGFTVYHGSPHSFDKFDLSKIGTGEGAQAYGHGLYFSDNEAVARSYRDNLSSDTLKTPGGEIFDPQTQLKHLNVRAAARNSGADLDAPLARAQQLLPKASEQTRPLLEDDIAFLQALKDGGGVASNPGHMYEARINADPNAFLDWDKPPSQQPQSVIDALGKIGVPLPADTDKFWMNTAANSLAERDGSWSMAAGARNVTQKLAEHGVPGVKYLDEGSRGPAATFDVGSPRDGFGPYSNYRNEADAQKQLELLRSQGFTDAEIKTVPEPKTRNYVVFDDSLVDIMRKYGFVPPAALGYEALQQQNGEPSSGYTPEL